MAASGDGPEAFLTAVAAGDCAPGGDDGDAHLLAHAIYAASFWRFREILRLDDAAPPRRALSVLRKGFGRIGRDVPVLEKTVRGVRSLAPGLYRDGDGRGAAWETLLDEELGSLLAAPAGIAAVGSRELNDRLFTVARRLADDVLGLHLAPLFDPAQRVGVRQALEAAFATGMVHLLELPYFMAWGLWTRDRGLQRLLRERYAEREEGSAGPLRVAVLTDSLAAGRAALADLGRLEGAGDGVEATILTSTPAPGEDETGVVRLPCLAARPLPNKRFRRPLPAGVQRPPIPSLLTVIDAVDSGGFDHVHAATSGPMGLAAVLAGRLLHLPLSGAARLPQPGGAPPPDPYERWFAARLDQVVPRRPRHRDSLPQTP